MRSRAGRRAAGLGRTIGRTAIIAGTAQAVTGRVAARQRARAAERAPARRADARPAMLTDEVVDYLKKLAELRDAGVLTEKEFAAKKAKLLA